MTFVSAAPVPAAPVPPPSTATAAPRAEAVAPIAPPPRVEPIAVVEPPKPIAAPPKPVLEQPKPVAEQLKPVELLTPVQAVPAAPKPEPKPESNAAPDQKAEPRDITELLRDFHIPAATPAEAQPATLLAEPPAKRSGNNRRNIAIVAGVVIVLGGGGALAARALRKPAPVPMGALAVQTNPPGVAVFVDGEAHGNTPARISLKAGAHILELRGRGVPRSIPVTITSGAEVSQYLELPQTPTLGSLLVQSDPAGAQVTVDGVDQGKAPANIAGLTPGEHEVVLQGSGGGPVRQRVVIEAGVTASVLAPVSTAAPGPVSGWISMKSPVTMEIRENGKLLGTTDTDRIMLAAGRHEIELSNDTLGYKATRAVQVPAGRLASLAVDLPQGAINLNASPWAEVFIDGKRVGETPLGNFPIAIGPHEVIFRHPQLGEKRQAVSVTLNAPVRVSVDMK
jgi:hypothetical protein